MLFMMTDTHGEHKSSTAIGPAPGDLSSTAGSSASAWNWLYKLGGAAAMVSVIIIPITIAVYFIWPPPETAAGHFEAIQDSLFVGLLGMDLLYLLGNIILIPTWLALYIALRRTNESLTAVALTLGLMGTISLIAGRPIVEMVSLSKQYAAAGTELEQMSYLAAGEAMMALYHGAAFNAHYLLGTIGLLIFSAVMLQSDVFVRRTAIIGIAANIITLGFYIPVIGVYISLFSVFFYFAWYLLIARRLWQLGQAEA
jgi:hypothetical protein